MHRSCDAWTKFDITGVGSVIRIEANARLTSANLLSTTQILIGLVDPVGARGIEYVEVYRILDGFGFVRHMWRNRQHLAGIDYDFFAIDPKLQRPFQNIGNLLVVVAVFGHDASFFQQDARHHDILTHDELTL